jgi:hypothetical protein
MLGMNTLRAITGGKLSVKEPAETATDQEQVETAEVHRIYPVATTATDPRLVELLKLVEELRADRDAWRDIALQARRRRWWWSR